MKGGGGKEVILPAANAGLPLYTTSTLYRLPFRSRVHRQLSNVKDQGIMVRERSQNFEAWKSNVPFRQQYIIVQPHGVLHELVTRKLHGFAHIRDAP